MKSIKTDFSRVQAVQGTFQAGWRDLLDSLNNNADGLILPPYKLSAALTTDSDLNVTLSVYLSRAYAVEGQIAPRWEPLQQKAFRNPNLADSLPCGQLFRKFFGRRLALTEGANGPMPLSVTLQPHALQTARDIINNWALDGVRKDQAAGAGHRSLRLVNNG